MFVRSLRPAGFRLTCAAFATVALSATAEAAAYITYVASNGNDTNPCTVVTAPCKTLQRAVNETLNNGTVRVLTPLQSDAYITKGITISGDSVPIVGSITISTGSTVVTLRGLALNGVGSGGLPNGVRINSAATVHIENCTVERFTGSGIELDAPTDLFISDTVSRDNGGHGLDVTNTHATVTVENSRFENNAAYGLRLRAAKASISRSVASRNGDGIDVLGGSTANITDTIVADNITDGIYVETTSVAIITSSVARGSTNGLLVRPGASVIITDSVFTHNTNGIYNYGTLYTRRSNTNNWNVTDYKLAPGGEKITLPAF